MKLLINEDSCLKVLGIIVDPKVDAPTNVLLFKLL